MATLCTCDFGLGNSGTPNCFPIGNVTNNLIIVPTYDSTGARNFIDTTATLDSTYFTARINDADTSKRWYPLPAMKNVEDVRAEAITESFNDGTTVKIQQGARTFTGMMIKQSPVLVGKIANYACTKISAFVIDIDGNIIGNGEEAGKLYPIEVDNESWDVIFMKATDTTVSKIQLNYTYDRNEDDGNLRMILASEMSQDVRDLVGLLDVNVVADTITTTTFNLTATFDYGSQVTPLPFEGAVLADFTLYNETTTSSIAITSVTEGAAGVYAFVYPAQTSADVMTLSLSKNGFEMADYTITIP